MRVLRGATVLDGLGGRIDNARVVIRDHKVSEVSIDRAEDPLPAGAETEDLTGKFLIPGLFDSHVHLGGSGGIGGGLVEQSDERQVHDLQAYLASGVTSILSLTDDPEALEGCAASSSAGTMRAPRTFFAGASITAPEGHPAAMFQVRSRPRRSAHEAGEDARRGPERRHRPVSPQRRFGETGPRARFRRGRPMPRLDLEVFKAAVAEAKKERGLKVTVHVGTDADARAAVEAGADGLEHMARGLSAETIALMAARKVTFTPTLTVYDFDWKRTMLQTADDHLRRLVIPRSSQAFSIPRSIPGLHERYRGDLRPQPELPNRPRRGAGREPRRCADHRGK